MRKKIISAPGYYSRKYGTFCYWMRNIPLTFILYLDRTADYAKLSMRYYDEGQQVVAVTISRPLYMNNPKITFNDESKLIVGGVSTMMKLPPKVTTTNYTGCVDDLEINNHIVGSWNSNFSQTAQVSIKVTYEN